LIDRRFQIFKRTNYYNSNQFDYTIAISALEMMKKAGLKFFYFLGVTLLLLGVEAAGFDPRPAAEKVDSLINAHLESKGLNPYTTISEDQFLRRTYLAIIGRVPTIEEVDAFLQSSATDKHSRLIQQLLSNDVAYTAHHYQFWADLLRVEGNVHWAIEYREWLKKEIAANTPYDEMVRNLVTGHGLVFENPAAGYYIRDTGMPLDNMSNTVRIFLGTRLECAQCHDHPFDKWTQMDYYRMAAFTYGYDHRGGNPHRSGIHGALKEEERAAYFDAVEIEDFPLLNDEDKVEQFLSKPSTEKLLGQRNLTEAQFRKIAMRGIAALKETEARNEPVYGSIGRLYNKTTYLEVRHLKDTDLELPHDYQYSDARPHDRVEPQTMFGAEVPATDDPATRKQAYADWLTSPDNPRFTRVIANRLWKRTFGHGIFEPVDDLTDHTTISKPDLLAYLEELMLELDYDVRAFQNVLFHTDLFRREMHREEHYPGMPFHFAGPLMQRMSAEQIWDSIAALVIPEIDNHGPHREKTMNRMVEKRATYHSLNGYPLDEVLPRMKQVGEMRHELYRQQASYEKRITEAYANGDNAKGKKLTDELKTISREFDQKSQAIVLVDLKGKRAADAAMMMGMSPGEVEESGNSFVKGVPRAMPEGLKDDERIRWKEEEQESLRHFNDTAREMARAVELDSPARRGHFLRDFGQSDRDVIENAVSNASVPQALYLLNSPLAVAISNSNSVLGAQLEQATDPTVKIETIYRAMLTRKPTEREVARILTDYETFGEEVIEDLVWALLNSRQFLFIQ
jgi:hypothetical protein